MTKMESIIKAKIDSGTMRASFTTNEGDAIRISDFSDSFSIYGPEVPSASVKIEVINVDSNTQKIIYEGHLSDAEINTFESSIPCPEDGVLAFSKKIEKRIHHVTEIAEIADYDFKIEHLFFGYCNTEECFDSSEKILENVLYIPLEKLEKYFKEYYEQDPENDEDWENMVREIIGDRSIFSDELKNNHTLPCLQVEGKGEWEYEYIKISQDSPWNIIHEWRG